MDQDELQSLSEQIQERNWIKVASISEAIQVANHLRDANVFDLFRGQLNADWPCTSSLERKNDAERARARTLFNDLHEFATTHPEMQVYLENEVALWAIAQHYGIPTRFIDFSTNPTKAAFFCADTNTPVESGTTSALYCLNSVKFKEFWAQMKPFLKTADPSIIPRPPEIIHIDVSNLWRLQAQEGCFLWNPIDRMEERWWHFDRILFPYGGGHSVLPRRDEIYPENQSPLEHLLTEFFMNQKMSNGAKTIFDQFGESSVNIKPPEGYYDGLTWSPKPLPHGTDWTNLDDWIPDLIEHVEDTLPGWTIEFASKELGEFSSALESAFNESEISQHRSQGVTIDLQSNARQLTRLARLIQRLWNGMRRLPYTNSEIEECVRNTVRLYLRSSRPPNKSWYVEFGKGEHGTGAYSRAHVSGDNLAEAFSDSFKRIALEAHPRLEGNLGSLIQLSCRPSQRFSFEGLRKLMVLEIIPSQLVERSGYSVEEELTIWLSFSPAELKIFGLC